MIRLGAVGDVVRTLPAASALRAAFAGAQLCWLVEPASASLLRGQPWLDEVLVFPRAELRAALRGGRLGRAAGIWRRFSAELYQPALRRWVRVGSLTARRFKLGDAVVALPDGERRALAAGR